MTAGWKIIKQAQNEQNEVMFLTLISSRTSKFPPRFGVLKFYHFLRLDCSRNVFIFVLFFFVVSSFLLLEKHFDTGFVLTFFLILRFLRLAVLIKKVYLDT